MASPRVLPLALTLAVLLFIPVSTFAETEELAPVELPYTCSVQSFRVLANGEVISVPVGQSRRRDYTFAGSASNTVEAVLEVRTRGAQEVRGQIAFDGEDAADVTRSQSGEVITFRAVRSVRPFTRVAVGYFVEAKPRVVQVRPGDSAFDEEGGFTLWTSGTLISIFTDARAHGQLRPGACEKSVEAYLRRRPVQRFARWTAVQVAMNFADLALAYFGGSGFIVEAAQQAAHARWGVTLWKRWVSRMVAEIIAGAAFDFTKGAIGNLIERGEFVTGDVPPAIFKSFVNGCFGKLVDSMGEWQGTMPNFIAGKIADVETEAAFAAWRDVAGEGPPEPGPEGEQVVRRLEEGVAEAEADLRRRGLTAEYLRFMSDDATVTVDGYEHRVRVLGAQWLVSGEGAILFVCGEGDPMRHKGYLVPFTSSRGNISLGSGGITEFTPTSGNTHSADVLARELLARAGRVR